MNKGNENCKASMNQKIKYHNKALQFLFLFTIISRKSLVLQAQTTSTNCNNYPPGLTIDEFIAIRQTEREFENEQLWEEANCFTWSIAESLDEEEPFPFLFCDGNGVESGKARLDRLRSIFESLNPNLYTNTNPTIITAFNEPLFTCWIMTLHFNEMISIVGQYQRLGLLPSIRANPISYYMKIVDGTISSASSFDSATEAKVVSNMVCPDRLENLPDISQETLDNLNQEVIDYILTVDEETGNSQVYQDLFWSQPSMQSNSEIRSWVQDAKAALDPSNEKCKAFYESLQLRFYRIGQDQFNTVTMMETTLKTTSLSSNSNFSDCIYAVLLVFSLRPEFCTVQIQGQITPQQLYYTKYNTPHPWVVQSISQTLNQRSFPFYDLGIKGTDQYIAVSDFGLDVSNCYFHDSDVSTPRDGSINLDARKVVQFKNYQGIPGGHGSAVSGAIAGNAAPDGITELLGWGYGIAYNAKLAFYDMATNIYPNINDLLKTGTPHAQTHCASWGTKNNGYDDASRDFDAYMYDNPDFLIVTVAGNRGDGDAANTVGNPGTAKNVLTVGASHSYQIELTGDLQDYHYVSGFSSRGPTSDGRTKPDVVATGEYIIAPTSNLNLLGACDAGSPPEPGQELGGLQSQKGTSYAAAVVAGSAALVRQYFEAGFYPTGEARDDDTYKPSGSLVKAILMNGAQFMNGVQDDNLGIQSVDPYDDTQNFGRVSLVDSLYFKTKDYGARFHAYDNMEIGFNDSPQTFDVSINLTSPCYKNVFRATLVWTDPPAVSGCSNCLLNDLDLVVFNKNNGLYYYPNGRTSPDSKNNAERVIFTSQPGETYQIIVTPHNLASATQKYSLVVSGCIGVPDVPLKNPESNPPTVNKLLIAIFAAVGGFGLCVLIGACMVEGIRRRQKVFRKQREAGQQFNEEYYDQSMVYQDEDPNARNNHNKRHNQRNQKNIREGGGERNGTHQHYQHDPYDDFEKPEPRRVGFFTKR